MERTHADGPVLQRYRTREIRASDLQTIQRVIESHGSRGRAKMAQRLCELWDWRHPRGDWKIGACWDLLRHLERQGLIALPPPQHSRRKAWRSRQPLSEHPLPVYPLAMEQGDLDTLVLRVISREEWLGWEILVDRFHYLRHRPIVGEHLRYAAYLEGQIVACLAWASAALRCPARDQFIGWDDATRKQRLPGVVNNTRFLILPWIRVPHLASKILATNLRRLDADWRQVWGHGLFLAETFVDPARFAGTCYRASNWIEVGRTQGRGKQGNRYRYHGRPKAVWLYPLHRCWRRRLRAPGPRPRAPAAHPPPRSSRCPFPPGLCELRPLEVSEPVSEGIMIEHAIPATLLALLTPFAAVFSRPGFENFQTLLVGWILCPGRHTISRVIQASAGMRRRPKHHAAFYRFLSRARWSVDALGQALLRLLLPFAGPDVVVLVDDTLCHRSGPHLFGAAMHHDALRSTYARGAGGGRTVSFAFGHNWVVLALAVSPPWNATRRFAVPILFRLYRSKKRTPRTQYRKRTALAADLLALVIDALPEGQTLHVVGDAEYACRTIVRSLPAHVHFTGPMAKDAALYAPPRPSRGRGRPALKGKRLASPAQLARCRSTPWRTIRAPIYGKKVSLHIKTRDCLWYTVAGTRPVRMILTRDPSGRIDDRAYFSTDTERSVEDLLRLFSYRWEIEVAFRNTKQTLGLQDPQNGWWRRPAGSPKPQRRPGPNPKGERGMGAIEHTLPFGFLAYALVILWYFRHGTPAQDVQRARRAAPWYAQKDEPSFADMLVAIRREIWAQRLSAHPPRGRLPEKNVSPLPDWALAA